MNVVALLELNLPLVNDPVIRKVRGKDEYKCTLAVIGDGVVSENDNDYLVWT